MAPERIDPPDELPGDDESLELIHLAKEGSEDALRELLDKHEVWLRRVARVQLGAQMRRLVDSVDLVQETWAVASRKLPELRTTSPAGLRRWLRQILEFRLREAVDRHTAQKRDVRRDVPMRVPRASDATDELALGPADPATGPDGVAERGELRELLDGIVAELPPDYRQVVLLRDYDHGEWEEIRAELGMPTVAAARQRHQRAWIRIRERAATQLDSLTP